MSGLLVRSTTTDDAAAIADIYNHYVRETVVTFEEEPVDADEMAGRIRESQSDSLPWLTAELDGAVVGFAFAGKWKGRCAYRFSVEVTVYLAPDAGGRGLGSRIYEHLLPLLKEQGIRTALGGIALPNVASVALHEKFGFEKVAHFREVGFKQDRWVDVGYWQKTL